MLLAALVLSGCGDGRPKTSQQQREHLLEAISQYGIDTLEAQPQDTLYGQEVGSILRHYPELYHASKKVKKAYEKWAEQSLKTNLGGQLALMDISQMLDEALLGSDDSENPTWPDLSAADSLYLQLLAAEPDTDRQSDIGRTRRAWIGYSRLLQTLLQTLPEECRQRYTAVVDRQARAFFNSLQQQENTKQQ